jgi:hypothetical protein
MACLLAVETLNLLWLFLFLFLSLWLRCMMHGCFSLVLGERTRIKRLFAFAFEVV